MTHDTAPARVTKRLRFEVFRRDQFRCRYCGLPAAETGEGLTIDHVTPVSLGGSNDPTNLVTACRDCNAGKTSSGPDEPMVAQASDDAVRWAAAVRQAHQDAQADLHAHEADVKAFGRYWNEQCDEPLKGGWKSPVRDFLAAGMTRADLLHFVDRTANLDRLKGQDARFRYFCGCCWNVVTDRQRRAQEMVGMVEPAPAEPELIHYPLYTIGNALRLASCSKSTVMVVVEELAYSHDNASEVLSGWLDFPSGEIGRHLIDEDLEAYFDAIAGGTSGDRLEVV